MPKKVRSARGEVVDFDLMNIQRQLAATPVNPDVAARQDFIDRRLRRRVRKVPAPAPKIYKEEEDEAQAPKLPGTEEVSESPKMIDEVPAVEEEKPVKKTRQKARPKAAPKETETKTEE